MRVPSKEKTTALWAMVFSDSGAQIRTEDLRVMSNAPESVPSPRTQCRGLCGGFCKPAKPTNAGRAAPSGFLLARHAAVVDQCAYSSLFTWVRQGHFLVLFMFSLFILPALIGVMYNKF